MELRRLRQRKGTALSERLREVIRQLEASQDRLVEVLRTVAGDQDWRPAADEWSFQEIAAHLATVERECFRERVARIASGEEPHFDYYSNTGRDFGQVELQECLDQWKEARRDLLQFVRGLPEERRSHTGTHATFGEITVLGALEIMVDHDEAHLRQLEQLVRAWKRDSQVE